MLDSPTFSTVSTARVCERRGAAALQRVCPFGVLRSIGGTRERHSNGISSKPCKLPDCPQCVRRAASHHHGPGVLCRGSGAPWNDGGRSFSTKERLVVYLKHVQKGVVFQEKGACSSFSGDVLRMLCWMLSFCLAASLRNKGSGSSSWDECVSIPVATVAMQHGSLGQVPYTGAPT